jgi:hypothetical protein
MLAVAISLVLIVLVCVCAQQARDITNLKNQLFHRKIDFDLNSRGGNISDEYSMEVPPPIPRMLQ